MKTKHFAQDFLAQIDILFPSVNKFTVFLSTWGQWNLSINRINPDENSSGKISLMKLARVKFHMRTHVNQYVKYVKLEQVKNINMWKFTWWNFPHVKLKYVRLSRVKSCSSFVRKNFVHTQPRTQGYLWEVPNGPGKGKQRWPIFWLIFWTGTHPLFTTDV